MKTYEKVMLVILDGWGHGPKPEVSAIAQAKTPFVDSLYTKYPNSELVTYGKQVGLPEGQMGNSEVGHLNIGAGRIVYQELARINKAIDEKTLNQNETLLNALNYAKDNGVNVHLLGLVSDGGVHSHINHLKGICDITEENGLENVFIHAFMDGRDTAPKGGLNYLKEVAQHIENTNVKVASVIGRYYAMDRDKRWERVKLAYDLLINGIGEKTSDYLSVLQKSYDNNVTDEFIQPISVTNEDGSTVGTIQPNDVVLSYNFRTDRCREITEVLTQQNMPEFNMKTLPLHYVTMTKYDASFKGVNVIFEKDNLINTLGEVLERAGKTQLRIAETEKYPHVTFFFNGGREKPFTGETRQIVPSAKVATYDLQPEMSAIELTDVVVKEIDENQPDFICLNYANADMVGHTGVFSAAIKAAETVDTCAKRLIEIGQKYGYAAIIIADHGNSDFMVNEDGTPHTAHTVNPVPCFFVTNEVEVSEIKNGKLGDVAPTILQLFDVEQPTEMDGESLLG
ncbi:MAG: 2,3-bisphosphoglycerate-independent phosphoglycerate mutase [Cognaticolwellia sp.]|jgi:2,3-bisphosphoglycerate-independent phosphoglycerate mutase